MPHVASDWKSQGLNRLLQQAGKQASMPASQKTTPFDSILDETSRPAPEPRTQRPTDDNSPRTERGQRTKSAERPNRTAKSDDRAKPSATDAPAKADSDADSTKIDDAGTKTTDAKATDTKSADATSGDKASDQTATPDDDSAAAAADTNPAGPVAVVPVAVVIDPAATLTSNSTATTDAKDEAKVESTAIGAATTTATPAAPAATAASGTAKAIAETAANPATAVVATDETTPETTSVPAAPPATAATAASTATAASKVSPAAASQADVAIADISAEAVLTQAQPNALAALGAKADKAEKAEKTDLKSDKKAEADKKAASAQTTFKPTVALDPKAAQADNGEPAKDTGAHAHAEATANSHRGVTADAANTAATNDGNAIATVSKAPDLTPPPGLTVQTPTHGAPAQTVAAPIAVAAQTDNSQPAVPIAGVAFEITSKALSGRNQFDIRLDPPDLGRIHVRLDVDRDGNVITHMVADRTDTLDLLRKDTAGLERALQDAGLKTSDNSLQFSLRDQQANQQQRNGGGESAHVVIEDEQLAAIEPAQRNYARYNAATGGLDIRV